MSAKRIAYLALESGFAHGKIVIFTDALTKGIVGLNLR